MRKQVQKINIEVKESCCLIIESGGLVPKIKTTQLAHGWRIIRGDFKLTFTHWWPLKVIRMFHIVCLYREVSWFWQVLKYNTTLESITVFIEIQWEGKGTPTVTLATPDLAASAILLDTSSIVWTHIPTLLWALFRTRSKAWTLGSEHGLARV